MSKIEVGNVGGVLMALTKVMSKGQLTIPVRIGKPLNLKEDDKVI